MPPALGELENLILLAILRLGEEAYGVSIRAEIANRTGRSLAYGTIYTALDRLASKGYVSSRTGEPTPERGGRRKRFYRLEPPGATALRHSWKALRRMSEGLEPCLGLFAEKPNDG